MLKFILYLFLIYFIVRFVFGKLFGASVKTKVFHYTTHHHHHDKPEDKEGTVKVQNTGNASAPKDDRKLGEYVDYEEVK